MLRTSREVDVADLKPLKGSCHCGRIAFSFSSTIPPEKYNPRACDCSFCQRHGALFISDPNGSLVLEVKEANALVSTDSDTNLRSACSADIVGIRRCAV